MFKPASQLKTIEEMIVYCQEIMNLHPEEMSLREQEKPAAALVGLFVNDFIDAWEEELPQLAYILTLASQLEHSNTNDSKEDWGKIKKLVEAMREKSHA